jgi:predicted peptidase
VVFLIAAAGMEQVTADAFTAGIFTDSHGTPLHYRLFEPPGYDAAGTTRSPLVTFLHANGDHGSDNRRQVREGARVWAEPANQKRHPAFVLAPQCPAGDGWGRPAGLAGYPAGSPLDALYALLDDLERRLPIDADRRYITGMSGGGWGTLRALSHQPERFAAAILVCPAGEPRKNPDVPPRENGVGVVAGLERLPLWFFHGTDDPVVPIALTRDRIAALRQAGGEPRLTEYPGVKHDAWVRAYAEPAIVDWLFGHRRAAAPPPPQ